ncbi:MAG: hypothetical protein AAF367_11530 [Pseudomonadota bacterium]
MIEQTEITNLIEQELLLVSNKRAIEHIRSLLIPPKPILLDWDYGDVDEQHLCWIVLEETRANIGIAYCKEGFGPTFPWGLVMPEEGASMGMDAGWFFHFIEAYVESAGSEVPIWCVTKQEQEGLDERITEQAGWDETWAEAERLRVLYPTSRYNVRTPILDGFER